MRSEDDKKIPRGRRSSRALPLVLATSATLSACSDDLPAPPNVVQDKYASLEDCRKDWGEESGVCTPDPSTSYSTSSDIGGVANNAAASSAASNAQSYAGGSGSGYHYGSGYGYRSYHHYYGPYYPEGQREYAQGQSTRYNYANFGNRFGDHSISKSVTRNNGVSVRGGGGGGHTAYAGSGGHSVSRGGFGSSAHGSGGG